MKKKKDFKIFKLIVDKILRKNGKYKKNLQEFKKKNLWMKVLIGEILKQNKKKSKYYYE